VDESRSCVTASINLLTVAGHAAFGELPERIRIIDLLTGARHLAYPNQVSLKKASDYITLLAESYIESGDAGSASRTSASSNLQVM